MLPRSPRRPPRRRAGRQRSIDHPSAAARALGSVPLAWLLLLCAVPCLVATAQPTAGPAPVVVARVVAQTVTAGQTSVGTIYPVKRVTVGSAAAG